MPKKQPKPTKNQGGLPERIKHLAAQIGGQSALAARIELNRHTVWEFATGRRTPPSATLLAIAGLYPCSLQWLETGEGDPPAPDPARAVQAIRQHRRLKSELLSPPAASRSGLTSPRISGANLPVMAFSYRGSELKIDIIKFNKYLKFAQETVSREFSTAERVLGPSLAHEVRSGRACPSPALMDILMDSIEAERDLAAVEKDL